MAAGWKASMSKRSSTSPGLGALSPPRSEDETSVRMKLMCSYGGRILPRTDNQLRYMGGESRIVAVDRSVTLPELLQKLRKLAGPSMLNVKYQLPGEELDVLVSVKSEEDLVNMMDEYDRLMQRDPGARLRVFLFPNRPQHQQQQQQQQHQQGVAGFTYRASDQQFIWRTRQLSCSATKNFQRLPPVAEIESY